MALRALFDSARTLSRN